MGRVRDASAGAGRELQGTLEALRGTAGSLSRLDELVEGMPVRLVIEGEPRPLSQVVEASAYRIVQEALTNARRHAPGREVTLTVSYGGDQLRVHLANLSDLSDKSDGGGFGIQGMRERAALLGGTLRAGPSAGGTFVVEATLPA